MQALVKKKRVSEKGKRETHTLTGSAFPFLFLFIDLPEKRQSMILFYTVFTHCENFCFAFSTLFISASGGG